MKKILLKALVAAGLVTGASGLMACGSDPYLGEVCAVTYGQCSYGYMAAQGQLLTIQQNAGLYSLIGTQFGGDGKTTFALPDLRSRVIVGASSYTLPPDGRTAIEQGKSRGVESGVLSLAQMPAHTHSAALSSTPVSVPVTLNASGTPPADNSNTTAPSTTNRYLSASPTTGGGMANIWSKQLNSPVAVSGLNGGTATVTGATVTVNPNGGSAPVNWTNPQLALNYCIATQGYYPSFD